MILFFLYQGERGLDGNKGEPGEKVNNLICALCFC